MLAFPNCKINLGLTVTAKRNDGYHDLETVFYPVGITDVLEIIPGITSNTHTISAGNGPVLFSASGLPVPGGTMDNLAIKAYGLLKKDLYHLPVIKMHLHKSIPMGAGLGGGSSDGAFALKLLNEIFNLNLSRTQLIDYAVQLGSDCPFFIINKPCLASSRGEMMEEISLDLSGYSLVLVNPGIHINTGWAFSQLGRNTESQGSPGSPPLEETISQPVSAWRQSLLNDFEEPVFKSYPEIKKLKEELYRCGALYASMTGSGSTVFGLFEKGSTPELRVPGHYTVMRA